MKRVCSCFLLLACLLFSEGAASGHSGGQAEALEPVNVFVSGKPLTLDPGAFIERGRTLVPMRAIFESLGATIDWDEATKTVTAVNDTTTIRLSIGAATATVNGVEVSLDVPAQVVDGRTFVPVRFVAESLGARVQWHGESQTAYISTPRTPKSEYEKLGAPLRAELDEDGMPMWIYREDVNTNGYRGQLVEHIDGELYIRLVEPDGAVYEQLKINSIDLTVIPIKPADGSKP